MGQFATRARRNLKNGANVDKAEADALGKAVREACSAELSRLLDQDGAVSRRQLSLRVVGSEGAADTWVKGTGWPWEFEEKLCVELGVSVSYFSRIRQRIVGMEEGRGQRFVLVSGEEIEHFAALREGVTKIKEEIARLEESGALLPPKRRRRVVRIPSPPSK